jgi:hypothetical protein
VRCVGNWHVTSPLPRTRDQASPYAPRWRRRIRSPLFSSSFKLVTAPSLRPNNTVFPPSSLQLHSCIFGPLVQPPLTLSGVEPSDRLRPGIGTLLENFPIQSFDKYLSGQPYYFNFRREVRLVTLSSILPSTTSRLRGCRLYPPSIRIPNTPTIIFTSPTTYSSFSSRNTEMQSGRNARDFVGAHFSLGK